MVKRLRASRALRAIGLYGILGACGYGIYAEWPQVSPSLRLVHWYALVFAALAAAAGSACLMMAWRELLADFGSTIRVPAAVRVMSVTQLAKYVPGGVWAVTTQVELGASYQVPRARGTAAVFVSVAVTLAVALAVAAAVLPVSAGHAVLRFWWVLAITPLVLVALWPPVLGRLLSRALKLLRRPPLEQLPSLPGLARVIGWTLVGWLLWGLQAWLLVQDLAGHGAGVLLVSVGGYALAWSVGMLAVFTPGGAGARELTLIAVLAPVLPRGAALTVALVSRAVMTASDLLWAALGLAAARLVPPAAPSQADAQPPPDAPPVSGVPVRWRGSSARSARPRGRPPAPR